MKNLFETLYSKTKNDVKNFPSDFEIDKKTIERNPGEKFIHITREHGTGLIMFINKDQYPEPGERVKYLFGTANREELIKGNLITLNHYINNNPKSVHFFNGHELKKINVDAAEAIYTSHIDSVINFWEEEERERRRSRDRQEFERLNRRQEKATAYQKAEQLEQIYGRI